MKQKLFSWGDKISVYDEGGNVKYFVKGDVFTLGKRLHIYNSLEEEIALIKRRIWSFLPKYTVEIKGADSFEVVKHFTLAKQRYSISPLGWDVVGDFWAHDYTVYDGNLPVATVAKEYFTFGDAYSIEIAPYADELSALAVVLVIDAALDEAN